MIIRHLLLMIVVTCCAYHVSAQNRLMLLGKGDSLGSIHFNNKYYSEYSDRFTYDIPKPPMTISGAVPFEVKFREVANEAVNDFQTLHLRGYGMYELNSLWLNGHQTVAYRSIQSEDWNDQEKGALYLKNLVCERPAIREALYNWLMPVYKVAFAAMSVPEQNAYLTLFRGAIAYLDNFDLEKEKAAVNDDFVYSRGYLNAFLYRRISKNEMSREDCRYWMQRIVTDFESVLRKDPQPADDYILDVRMNHGYFTATYYTDYEEAPHPPAVMRKENEQYRILPDVRFDETYYVFPDIIFGFIRVSGDSVQRAIFHCDSLSYSYTRCQFPEYPQSYLYLGDGQNKRLLMIHGWTEVPDKKYGSQTVAKCAIVDLDSGTVLARNLLVPAAISYDPDTDDEVYSFSGNIQQEIIYCNDETRLWGVLDGFGNEIIPAKYISLESTEIPGVYKANGRKKVKRKK